MSCLIFCLDPVLYSFVFLYNILSSSPLFCLHLSISCILKSWAIFMSSSSPIFCCPPVQYFIVILVQCSAVLLVIILSKILSFSCPLFYLCPVKYTCSEVLATLNATLLSDILHSFGPIICWYYVKYFALILSNILLSSFPLLCRPLSKTRILNSCAIFMPVFSRPNIPCLPVEDAATLVLCNILLFSCQWPSCLIFAVLF